MARIIFKGLGLACIFAITILSSVWLVGKIPGYEQLPCWVKTYGIPIIIGVTCGHYVRHFASKLFKGKK
jgi:cytochrome bd-type quinol oxidase subunit 1